MSTRVVAIGVFDGVHIGHQDLLSKGKLIADLRNIEFIALTFHPHPMSVVKKTRLELLSTLEQRKHWLISCGVNDVYICDFTHEFSQRSADDFVTSFLQATLQAQVVVIGEGFRFGFKAAGTADTIRSHGLEVIEVPHTFYKGERVSSTRIRSLLKQANLNDVACMLGRHFEVEGSVVKGFQRGRELGFPTANIQYEDYLVLPKDGVYAGYLNIDSFRLPAAISLGHNATFHAEKQTLEVYAITDEWLDLYGKTARVEFVEFVRDMQKYDGVGPLVEAIENDILSVKKTLNLG